jgi:alpha-beta hydrolase superfamily lysophospholipase
MSPPTPAPKVSGRLRRRLFVSALIGGIVLAGCSSLETQQRKWIFRAVAAAPSTPAELAEFAKNYDMEDVWIEHPSKVSGRPIRLHALWAPNDEPTAPVLLYLHGARRDVGANVYRIDRLRDLGFSVLAVDYRGFGNSTNELPSEQGAVEDARAAWRWLSANHPGRDHYLFGYSLGGAVAVQLAAQLGEAPEPGDVVPKGLMLESTFTSISDMFQTLRWGWLPITPLITERFDSLSAIGRVKAPLLVVHGSEDRFVPARFGQALYERAGAAKKRFVLIDGGTHYSTIGRGVDQYREALRELFGLGS